MELKTEKTEPNKIGDLWTVTVIATVFIRRGVLAKYEAIRFFLGNKEEACERTDDKGMASHEFTLSRGSHTVFVRLESGASDKVPINLEDKAPIKVAKIATSESRAGKTHVIIYEVLTAEDKPVANVVLRVLDPGHAGGFYDLTATDIKGIAVDKVTFVGKEKSFKVMALGSGKSVCKSLYN